MKALRSEIVSYCPSLTGPPRKDSPVPRALVVIDSLNSLAASHPRSISAFLSTLVSPTTSVLGVFHTDVPLVINKAAVNEYEPHPLVVLCHLATAVFRVSSLYQAVEQQQARNRSQQEPEWGLKEGREGVLIGIKNREQDLAANGIVVEMEMRRRSGRAVAETFIVARGKGESTATETSNISLLSDHAIFATPEGPDPVGSEGGNEPGGGFETTFNLGLTEKQRRDREGVSLPYFDAQTDIGAGEGGRILYEMGREDDFDDEEDEI